VNKAQTQRIALPIVFLTVLMLNACTTVGPDFEEPEVAWLNDWQPDLYGQIGNAEQQTEVDLRFWWRLFNDPVLNGLIETARRENPALRIAGLRILESRAVLGIAGSNLYPQLQQLGGAVTYVSGQQRIGQAENRDQRLARYQATFDFGWALDFWGRFRRGIESADAAFFASIASQQDVQVLLSAQVADVRSSSSPRDYLSGLPFEAFVLSGRCRLVFTNWPLGEDGINSRHLRPGGALSQG
jgi:outer membrane protein TolC